MVLACRDMAELDAADDAAHELLVEARPVVGQRLAVVHELLPAPLVQVRVHAILDAFAAHRRVERGGERLVEAQHEHRPGGLGGSRQQLGAVGEDHRLARAATPWITRCPSPRLRASCSCCRSITRIRSGKGSSPGSASNRPGCAETRSSGKRIQARGRSAAATALRGPGAGTSPTSALQRFGVDGFGHLVFADDAVRLDHAVELGRIELAPRDAGQNDAVAPRHDELPAVELALGAGGPHELRIALERIGDRMRVLAAPARADGSPSFGLPSDQISNACLSARMIVSIRQSLTSSTSRPRRGCRTMKSGCRRFGPDSARRTRRGKSSSSFCSSRSATRRSPAVMRAHVESAGMRLAIAGVARGAGGAKLPGAQTFCANAPQCPCIFPRRPIHSPAQRARSGGGSHGSA